MMKRCLAELMRRTFALGLQLLVVAPLFLLLSCGFSSSIRHYALLSALGCAALCLAIGFAPPRARKLLFPVLALLSGVGAYLLPAAPGQEALHFLYAALCVALVVLLSIAQRRGMSTVLMAIGVPVHLIAGVISGMDICAPVRHHLMPLAYVYLGSLVFHMNVVTFVDQYAGHAQRPALRMRLGNAAMSAIFLMFLFGAYQFDHLRRLVGEALRRVVLFLFYLLSLLAPSQVAQDNGGAQSEMMGIPAAGEPSMIWMILEKLFMVLAVVLIGCLLLFGLIKLCGALRTLMAKLRALVAHYLGAISADYVDETETVSGWEELRQGANVRIRRALSRLTLGKSRGDMDNRQRVRAAYRRLRYRSDAPNHMTASEVLSTILLDNADAILLGESYDRARYSDHPISDAEADHARRASL